MTGFADERGQPVLPGFEGEFEYRQPKGHGTGQTSSQTEDWYTHPEVVYRTRVLFGKIDLDPMSCEQANRVVQAETYYTAEIDGLTRPWYGNILWNPPWGGSNANTVKRRGVQKLLYAFKANEVENAVCVLNANAITTSWFSPLLAFPVCIPPKRIAHYGPNGEGGAPNSGTILVYVGINVMRFAEVFGDLGRIIIPFAERRARFKHVEIGSKFGRWTVVGVMQDKEGRREDKAAFPCQCDCGSPVRLVYGDGLVRGMTRGCQECRDLRERRNEWLRSEKSHPCQRCGGSFHYAAMDFDHANGREEGDFSLSFSNLHRKEHTLETLKLQRAKCILLCANCHREVTWLRRMKIEDTFQWSKPYAS